MSENYKFFQNKDCEFFPCHKGADEATFNCLFCFCPLYALGKDCGGDFTYTATGIKDCSNCLIPHSPQGYDYIMSKMDEVMEIARKKD
jgi:Zn-finger protein